MRPRSRRSFLITAAGSALASRVLAAPPGRSTSSPADEAIDVRQTWADRRYAPAPALRWRTTSGESAGAAVVIDAQKSLQPVLGFGAAFTDAACTVIGGMPEKSREALMRELFDPGEMALSVGRTCIGSSDYAREIYSYDEGEPDAELRRFSIDHDRDFVLPVLRRARALQPDLFLLASPWSPPGWMKDNGSMKGGTIRTRYLDVYAQYFVRFLTAYKDAGVPIDAVSSQNEVDTDQDSRMPACLFPQEVEVKFVAQSLGPALEKAGLGTKIWLIDHNYNLWGRAIVELDDPTVRRYSNAIAWHGYVGQPEWMQKVAAAHPDVEMYWTEGGPDYTDPGYLTDWAKWGRTFAGILRNGARCIIGWNFALDESGRPNVGPFPCGGVVTVHSRTKEVTRSGQYWAFAHYSRAIRRGAVVVASHGAADGIDHVAARHPDGRYVLVLTNSGRTAATVPVRLGTRAVDVTLPADSISTLRWS